MTTMRMRKATIACAAALALLGACSDDSDTTPEETTEAGTTEDQTPAEEPTEDPTPTEEPSPSDGGADPVPVQVWFSQGNRLAPAIVEVDETIWEFIPGTLEALFEGPSGAGGLTSAIPPETRLNNFDFERGTATVDLSSEFESGSGIPTMGMRLGQLTFTLTQVSSRIKRVVLEIDGERVRRFSNEGLVIEKPLTRLDFEDISPAIIVNRPLGDSLTPSPVTVAGTANVFEANVLIRIVDSDGEVLAETFTTATCGSGCRGRFSEDVEFDVDEPTEAVLQVYEESAESGRPMNMIEVPVTLVP